MAMTPSCEPYSNPAPESAAVLRDEIAEHRVRRLQTGSVPLQRPNQPGPLSDPDREHYELQLDAYEVQLAEYESRLDQYATQLDAAHHDGLTGTWLRQAGRLLLEQELARSSRHDTPMSIAFVDIDGLKVLNDECGHAAGDKALITVARALLVGLRGYDQVVRWGGDEFLCVLSGSVEDEAVRRIEQARGFLWAGGQGLTISVGVAERRAGENVDELVARADRALYVSRESGALPDR